VIIIIVIVIVITRVTLAVGTEIETEIDITDISATGVAADVWSLRIAASGAAAAMLAVARLGESVVVNL
jgi:hypothetical protein